VKAARDGPLEGAPDAVARLADAELAVGLLEGDPIGHRTKLTRAAAAAFCGGLWVPCRHNPPHGAGAGCLAGCAWRHTRPGSVRPRWGPGVGGASRYLHWPPLWPPIQIAWLKGTRDAARPRAPPHTPYSSKGSNASSEAHLRGAGGARPDGSADATLTSPRNAGGGVRPAETTSAASRGDQPDGVHAQDARAASGGGWARIVAGARRARLRLRRLRGTTPHSWDSASRAWAPARPDPPRGSGRGWPLLAPGRGSPPPGIPPPPASTPHRRAPARRAGRPRSPANGRNDLRPLAPAQSTCLGVVLTRRQSF
jgi:hypothetical protein